MIEVADRVWVSGQARGCVRGEVEGRAFVHACKQPCHQRAVGYRGTLPRTHAHYLSIERGNHLYLNVVDAALPLFFPESFALFREFAVRKLGEGLDLTVHCNQGESRAPSLALLLLAKDLKLIPSDSYEVAAEAFRKLYTDYHPGRGIAMYLSRGWAYL